MTTVYLITQKGCVNCPAAKLVLSEALEGTCVSVKEVDLDEMDPDFEYRLLEAQVFIASTPTILVENGKGLTVLWSGRVPTVEQVREAVGVNGK
ncbi:MAG: thioredoxin family protein [Candidatus Thorarchaeota archaeon]